MDTRKYSTQSATRTSPLLYLRGRQTDHRPQSKLGKRAVDNFLKGVHNLSILVCANTQSAIANENQILPVYNNGAINTPSGQLTTQGNYQQLKRMLKTL